MHKKEHKIVKMIENDPITGVKYAAVEAPETQTGIKYAQKQYKNARNVYNQKIRNERIKNK
ncbi:MAG: hypothetical protein E7007_00645 [Alphaproteobacteria bacterium]|nr:hypothetical protein [Alphaproteobacteria bacterium]